MEENPSKTGMAPTAARKAFPDDEARIPWLSMLLGAYHTVDVGIAEAIQEQQAQGRVLTCTKGCANCCRAHRTIPVYPLELAGLTRYVTEHVAEPTRSRLREQLRRHTSGDPCPFLVDDLCAVHPLRPMACRQFNVFGQACGVGEDADYTRREDVLTPIKH